MTAVASATAGSGPLTRLRDVVALAKPRLSSLVLFTAGGGMWLAPGRIGPWRASLILMATLMIVGGANALNCYLERDSDRLMRRTRNRPLPAGRLEPRLALVLGISWAVAALPILALASNVLTAALAALAHLSYVLVYTPMKRRSTWALVVGCVPGAIPPLMGWTAVTGRLDPGGLALFAILFWWQLPHFLAVSYYLREDYARGGLRVFSIVHGEGMTRLITSLSIVALIPVSYLPVGLGLAGPAYFAVAVVLGLVFLGWSLLRAGRKGGARWARNLFLVSLVYLTFLFVALIAGAP